MRNGTYAAMISLFAKTASSAAMTALVFASLDLASNVDDDSSFSDWGKSEIQDLTSPSSLKAWSKVYPLPQHSHPGWLNSCLMDCVSCVSLYRKTCEKPHGVEATRKPTGSEHQKTPHPCFLPPHDPCFFPCLSGSLHASANSFPVLSRLHSKAHYHLPHPSTLHQHQHPHPLFPRHPLATFLMRNRRTVQLMKKVKHRLGFVLNTKTSKLRQAV